MPIRDFPFGAFNFLVDIKSSDGSSDSPAAGFSDVTGLGAEFTMAEYRNGNEALNHVRKISGLHKVSDVTLKRGVIGSTAFWEWITQQHTQGRNAKRDVQIRLRGEDGAVVQTWTLQNASVLKHTGPTLAAKGGTDVAMEELVLTVEGLDVTIP